MQPLLNAIQGVVFLSKIAGSIPIRLRPFPDSLDITPSVTVGTDLRGWVKRGIGGRVNCCSLSAVGRKQSSAISAGFNQNDEVFEFAKIPQCLEWQIRRRLTGARIKANQRIELCTSSIEP